MIEIIDLFSGPGGLGEGFTSYKVGDKQLFNVKISIEKEKFAHETLTLRSFYRKFERAPKEYYEYLQGKITKYELFKRYPAQAKQAQEESYQAELGSKEFPHEEVLKRIKSHIKDPKNSIVIGGPPCQAYSLWTYPSTVDIYTKTQCLPAKSFIIVLKFKSWSLEC